MIDSSLSGVKNVAHPLALADDHVFVRAVAAHRRSVSTS